MKDIYREASDKLNSKECSNGSPLLIILVGESGVGKSTFCNAVGCQDNWYVSSDPIIKLVQNKGLQINHDTIHACAREAYNENPAWQIPFILEAMNGKDFLLLDGPRRFHEIKSLKEQYPKTLIVRIIASDEERFARLKKRDGIDREDFQRILRDEAQETELIQILNLTDIVVDNNGTIEQIQAGALELKEFLSNNRKKQ